jgi:hypothetical protein
MEYLILILCIAGIGGFLAVRRGRTTVRAALYLSFLEDGMPVGEANSLALGTGYKDAARYQDKLLRYATAPFGGSQLQMIARARQLGVRG